MVKGVSLENLLPGFDLLDHVGRCCMYYEEGISVQSVTLCAVVSWTS